jgi:hypothetical protein
MSDRDLPEGVIDADPPGAWESSEASDTETQEQNEDAVDSPELVTSDEPAKGADPDLNVRAD